jgi:hypothetical protein
MFVVVAVVHKFANLMKNMIPTPTTKNQNKTPPAKSNGQFLACAGRERQGQWVLDTLVCLVSVVVIDFANRPSQIRKNAGVVAAGQDITTPTFLFVRHDLEAAVVESHVKPRVVMSIRAPTK